MVKYPAFTRSQINAVSAALNGGPFNSMAQLLATLPLNSPTVTLAKNLSGIVTAPPSVLEPSMVVALAL